MDNKYFCPKCGQRTEHEVRPMSIILVLICSVCESQRLVLFQQTLQS